MKKKSLSERSRMQPVKIYGDMIKEVPLDLLEQPASFNYFGSSTHMLHTQKRRELNNMKHNSLNTTAVENDQFFINNAKADMHDADVDLSVRGYQEHIEQGNNRNVKWRLNNYPYNWPGQGASRLWAELVKADNMHGVLDFQGDILPTSLMRGQDSELKQMRNLYLNEYGLYKVIPYAWNTFKEWGADVETAGYFCKKGYDGNITVKTSISEYDYDFRSLGFIMTPDTLLELVWGLSCLESSEKYKFKSNELSLNGQKLGSMRKVMKDKKIYSDEKTKTHKYPILKELRLDGNHKYGYTNAIIDSTYGRDRLICPYLVGAYNTEGRREIGAVFNADAEVQVGSYLIEQNLTDNLDIHSKYLTSLPVKALMYMWRTSKTNDNSQLKIIPKLTDFTVETDDDILKFLGGTDIKEEIENGYARKTGQK